MSGRSRGEEVLAVSLYEKLFDASRDPRVEALVRALSGADYSLQLDTVAETAPILNSRGADRLALIADCTRVYQRGKTLPHELLHDYAFALFADLFRKLLNATDDLPDAELCAVIDCCSGESYREPSAAFLRIAETRFADRALPEPMRRSLQGYLDRLELQIGAEPRKLRERVRRLLLDPAERSAFNFSRVDAWTDRLCSELDGMEQPERDAWLTLLTHAATASGTKPTRAFTKRAAELIAAIGRDGFRATILAVLDVVGRAAPFPVQVPGWEAEWVDGDPTLVSQHQADTLRGLIWCAGLELDAPLVLALGDAAERCFKKGPGVGPRAPKIANACVGVLAQTSGPHAVAQLSRLATRVKHASSKKQVEKALDLAAQRAGISRQELEDLAVPTCGLTAPGTLDLPLGEYTAHVRVTSSTSVELTWSKAGKVQKSIPASVKEQHAAALAELKRNVDELKKLVPAQRDRLELMALTPRVIPFGVFQERFLDHPLIGYLARRLIWQIGGQRAIHDGDGLTTLAGERLTPAPDAAVTLWHPIESSADEVRAWRDYLHRCEIVQPFKQAHREIYMLTEAERATRTYSNRFAAHILRQHQLAALATARSWRYLLQGGFDSANTPHRLVPDQDLRAELWVDPLDTQLTEAGIYLYVVTDQVRFVRGGDVPVELEDVPPRLFSELLRDVDLFVGVASVGNDPNWRDGGERGAGYWTEYAFGALGETAKTRHAVLERLLPMLKIGKQCTLEERFLVVKGSFREYRIHLGSGNIQMSPNDQYLCIVADRREAPPGKLVLPFEGDSMLSLILSKAILLAADRDITDPTIQTQIGPEFYAN